MLALSEHTHTHTHTHSHTLPSSRYAIMWSVVGVIQSALKEQRDMQILVEELMTVFLVLSILWVSFHFLLGHGVCSNVCLYLFRFLCMICFHVHESVNLVSTPNDNLWMSIHKRVLRYAVIALMNFRQFHTSISRLVFCSQNRNTFVVEGYSTAKFRPVSPPAC